MARVAHAIPRRRSRAGVRTAAPTVRVATVALAAVVLLGCALRTIGLDGAPLRNDELNHYYVATSLAKGGAPALPSGEWYLRGIDFTRAVALGLAHVAPIERAVRLPSALLGCAALITFAFVARGMAGPAAAIAATVLMALDPESIHQARSGRFYTMQMVFGLIAFFAGWRALGGGWRRRDDARSLATQWAWFVLTLGALAMAVRVQVTAFGVCLAFGVATAVVAAGDVRRWRTRAIRGSAPLQLSLLGVICVSVLALARPEMIAQTVARAFAIPLWIRSSSYERVGYLAILAADLPLLLAAAPIAFFHLLRRRPALGGYLLAWFAIPLIAQSMLPWKNGRFIVLALPALFLAIGIGAAELIGGLHRALAERGQRRLGQRAAVTVATAVVALLAAGALTPTPAFTHALRPIAPYGVAGWSEMSAIIASLPDGASIPLGHGTPLPAYHYLGRLDFTVSEGALEQWRTRERKLAEMGVNEEGGYVRLPMGAPDLYTGAPVLTGAEAIRARFEGADGVLIGLDTRTLAVDGVDPALYRMLDEEADELCRGRCGPMMLYHWRFERRETDSREMR